MGFDALCWYEKIGITFLMIGCFCAFLFGTVFPEFGVKHFFMFANPEEHTQLVGFGCLGSMALAMSVITFLGVKSVTKESKKKWFFTIAVARTCIAFGFTLTYIKQGDGFNGACLQWGLAAMLYLFHLLAPCSTTKKD